jgi:hypothetical protein
MKLYVQIIAGMSLLAGMIACSPKMPANPESTSTSQPMYPLTTRTGVEEIDRILDASGDVQKLRALVAFTSTKCTKQDGLGGPPKCLPGEEEGTPVDVLPFLGPEGSFLRKAEIGHWPGFETSGIFAIYQVSSNAYSDENYPAGHYAILFLGEENQPAISLRVREGRIVRVDYVFDDSPESLDATLQRESARLILAPIAR